MSEENSPKLAKKAADKKWLLIGCGLMILFAIALFVIIFWVGAEFANPWGKDPGPGP